MSFSINQIVLAGNVSQEPELKYTPSNVAVCNFSMATSRSVKKGDGYENVPTFHRIVVWQKMAEIVAGGLKKGQQVTVRGRLDNRTYEQDGVKKYISEIVAEDVVFNSPRGETTTKTQAPKQSSPAKEESKTEGDYIRDPETGEVLF